MGAADTGWTAYVPLSTLHSPGHGQDIWILSLHILSLSSAAGAINFIVTIHNMRAPGMSWTRIPLFCWSILTYAWMLIIVLPTLSAGLTMMLLDRQAGTNFFNPAKGGSPLLYQHVFWFFGHPEVYIIVLPTMGIISEIIPVFARKPIFGYKAVAFSTLGIAFFSLLVWAHHMFAVGLPVGLNIFFMLSSMVIAIPTGVKIINWLATMWRGNISFEVFPGMGTVNTQDDERLGVLLVQLARHLRTAGGVDDDVQVRKLQQIGEIDGDEKIVAVGVQDARSFRIEVRHSYHPEGFIFLAGRHQSCQDGHPLPAHAHNGKIIFGFKRTHEKTPGKEQDRLLPPPLWEKANYIEGNGNK